MKQAVLLLFLLFAALTLTACAGSAPPCGLYEPRALCDPGDPCDPCPPTPGTIP